MSTPEEITAQYAKDLKAIDIEVNGSQVVIRCLDDFQAQDLAKATGLLLADRAAGWTRVAEMLPSQEELTQRLYDTLESVQSK